MRLKLFALLVSTVASNWAVILKITHHINHCVSREISSVRQLIANLDQQAKCVDLAAFLHIRRTNVGNRNHRRA